MDNKLYECLRHLQETGQEETYEIVKDALQSLQWKASLAYNTAEDLLCLIEFCANHDTFENGNVSGGYDEGVVTANKVIRRCENDMRRLNKWGRLPWEGEIDYELVIKKNS